MILLPSSWKLLRLSIICDSFECIRGDLGELVIDFVSIFYSFWRQDVAVAQITFYKVTGLKSLASHCLRSCHTHKVWYWGVDESLTECGKA